MWLSLSSVIIMLSTPTNPLPNSTKLNIISFFILFSYATIMDLRILMLTQMSLCAIILFLLHKLYSCFQIVFFFFFVNVDC